MNTTTRTFGRTAGVLGAAGALVLVASPAMADNHTATVSVLHAVPDTPVDVYANGERLIDDFQPGTLTDPLTLPAGDYDLALYPADAADASGEPLLSAMDVAVPAGANATVVAHLTEGGDPALTPFVNETGDIPAGQARLTVRHVAAAPAVDVRAGGEVVVDGLTNPNGESLTVPAGTVTADVVLAGTDTVAIGPADLSLAEGTTTIAYAWGSGDAGYELAVQTIAGQQSAPAGVPGGSGDAGYELAVQTIAGQQSAPAGVPGGSAGLADDSGLPLPVGAAALAGVALAAAGAVRLARAAR
ncbi:DUF4397 domain-containing protein [Blastococcus saxobsidens]|uniref:DUF4397 domain-containing protein n=1 Tax=Blastococcus saxobsidens (strain DD2) TaxID=1146883 RepID=H6RKD7_BLASD|nr:DUF4397 domain-containing protein [Blastococcus saxobsidens]CCG01160.1 conserved exported protein of unknown function [Blastococcus saxobsidens DD2]